VSIKTKLFTECYIVYQKILIELDIVLRFTAVITIGTIFVRIDTEIDTVFENFDIAETLLKVALNKIIEISISFSVKS
jgi:hypothetical protein